MANQTLPGAPYNQNAVQIAKIETDYAFDRDVRSIDVVGAGVTVTLGDGTIPSSTPRTGDRHWILASGGDVTVDGGLYPILGNGGIVSQGSAAYYELSVVPVTPMTPKGFAWIPLGAGGAFGVGEIVVPNLAGLVALHTNGLDDQIRTRVKTLDGIFELDKTSTALTDGITILPTFESNNGALPGRWLRIENFSKKWSLQINWFVDAVGGDDENKGDTALTALKTAAESVRRRHQAAKGRNYQVTLINDVPLQEAAPRVVGGLTMQVAVKDTYRPSDVAEQNREDINGSTGYEQTFNETFQGLAPLTRTGAVTGTLTAFAATSGNNQNTVTAAPGTLDVNIGQMFVITADPNPGSPALGAVFGVGENLGGGQVRISRVFSAAGAQINLAGNETFAIVNLVKWAPPIIQYAHSQGRYLIQHIEFSNVLAPPSEQSILTLRYSSLTWTRCRFRRNSTSNVAGINGTAFEANGQGQCGLNACIFDYSGLVGQGVGGTAIVVLANAYNACAPNACLFINADIRGVRHGEMAFNSCYVQHGRVTTFNPNTFVSYGFFNVGAGFGGADVTLLGQGLTIYDWPVSGSDDYGIKLSSGSFCNAVSGANLGGTNATAGSIGLRAQDGGRFFWLTPGSTAPTITGALADLRLENQTSAKPSVGSWDQSGSDVLVNGTSAPIAANLDSAASIQVTMRDPGAGAITGFAALDVPAGTRVNGAPGSFVVNAINDSKAVIATAACTFDWTIRTPPVLLTRWSEWQAEPFLRKAMNYETGSAISQSVG